MYIHWYQGIYQIFGKAEHGNTRPNVRRRSFLAKYWKEFIGRDIIPENNAGELYFEECDIENFVYKLEKLYPDVKYVNRLMTHSWGQKVIRFYDLDGNLIEVGTPMR